MNKVLNKLYTAYKKTDRWIVLHAMEIFLAIYFFVFFIYPIFLAEPEPLDAPPYLAP